jgi:hypothetical protein
MQGYFGEDCSNEATHLMWDVPVYKEEAAFECAPAFADTETLFVLGRVAWRCGLLSTAEPGPHATSSACSGSLIEDIGSRPRNPCDTLQMVFAACLINPC